MEFIIIGAIVLVIAVIIKEYKSKKKVTSEMISGES